MERDQWAHEEEISFLSALPPLPGLSFAICCSETLEEWSCYIYDLYCIAGQSAISVVCYEMWNLLIVTFQTLWTVVKPKIKTWKWPCSCAEVGEIWCQALALALCKVWMWQQSLPSSVKWWNMKYRPCGEFAYKQKARQKGANVKDVQRLMADRADQPTMVRLCTIAYQILGSDTVSVELSGILITCNIILCIYLIPCIGMLRICLGYAWNAQCFLKLSHVKSWAQRVCTLHTHFHVVCHTYLDRALKNSKHWTRCSCREENMIIVQRQEEYW